MRNYEKNDSYRIWYCAIVRKWAIWSDVMWGAQLSPQPLDLKCFHVWNAYDTLLLLRGRKQTLKFGSNFHPDLAEWLTKSPSLRRNVLCCGGKQTSGGNLVFWIVRLHNWYPILCHFGAKWCSNFGASCRFGREECSAVWFEKKQHCSQDLCLRFNLYLQSPQFWFPGFWAQHEHRHQHRLAKKNPLNKVHNSHGNHIHWARKAIHWR